MTTLYRHYRPQTFAELVGQDHVRESLQQALARDKLTHAYLFHGPRGTGKTTSARLLAARVNCSAAKGAEPCGQCASCRALKAGNHPDIIEIDAASNRGIDDVRALREAAKFVPALGRKKVYIIDEVHMLTREAASALLKTLEEPAAHIMFILATTEMSKVLPTIISRCQVYRFRRARPEEMAARLTHILTQEKRSVNAAVMAFIIERSDGCYRDAESLLGQLLTWREGELTLEQVTEFLGLPPQALLENFLRALVASESAPAVASVDEAFAAGVDPEQFLKEAVRLARDGALTAATGGSVAWVPDAGRLSERAAVIIRALLTALQDLAYVPEPLIALHLAILTVCTKQGAVAPAGETPGVNGKTPGVKEAGTAAAVEAPRNTESLDKTKAAWPDLIASVKDINPVAATFLRAVEPAHAGDNRLTIKVHYSLHRTFFEKPSNRQLLASKLHEITGQKLEIDFVLAEEARARKSSVLEQNREQDQKFSETVKEIFG